MSHRFAWILVPMRAEIDEQDRVVGCTHTVSDANVSRDIWEFDDRQDAIDNLNEVRDARLSLRRAEGQS